MAVGFLAWEFMVLQERVRQMERRIERRQLRDMQNPFALPRNEFMHIFRISPDLAMEIINLLRPDLIRQRSTGIFPEIQTLITIHNIFDTAFRMIPELIELNCCTAESTPTKCGIHVIWTTMSHRKQGIATKLIDTLRAKFFYGYVMSLDDIEFSMPTPSGKIFAEKHTKTRNFKVYN